MQPDDVNLWYFKLTLFDLTAFIVWNIKGLRHWVAKILKLENQSLWQKLNSFTKNIIVRSLFPIKPSLSFCATGWLELLCEYSVWQGSGYPGPVSYWRFGSRRYSDSPGGLETDPNKVWVSIVLR